MDEETLDLRGLKCPLPALFSRRALARAPSGGIIEVWVDDPMAPVDVPYMCHREGYDVLEIRPEAHFVRIRLGRRA